MSPDLDAVWFDLDGTLVDSGPGIEWALSSAVADVLPGVALPPVITHIGPPVPELLRRLLPDHAAAHGEIANAFRRYYDDHDAWLQTEPYPGISEALDALAEGGLRLDVVTNKRALPTGRILDRFGLRRHFTAVVSPDSVSPAHPTKAAALSQLLRTTGLSPDRVAYVGDTDGDREAAQLTACWFVKVEWGFGGAGAPPARQDLATVSATGQLPFVLLPPRRLA